MRGPEASQYVGLQRRDDLQDQLESNQILKVIHRLQSLLNPEEELESVLAEFLSALIQLTDSEHGFCGEVRTDQDGKPCLGAYSTRTRSGDRPLWSDAGQDVEFRKPNSLIEQVIDRGEPVVTDGASADLPIGGQSPDQRSPATFAGLPLKFGKVTVGIICLANGRPATMKCCFLESSHC